MTKYYFFYRHNIIVSAADRLTLPGYVVVYVQHIFTKRYEKQWTLSVPQRLLRSSRFRPTSWWSGRTRSRVSSLGWGVWFWPPRPAPSSFWAGPGTLCMWPHRPRLGRTLLRCLRCEQRCRHHHERAGWSHDPVTWRSFYTLLWTPDLSEHAQTLSRCVCVWLAVGWAGPEADVPRPLPSTLGFLLSGMGRTESVRHWGSAAGPQRATWGWSLPCQKRWRQVEEDIVPVFSLLLVSCWHCWGPSTSERDTVSVNNQVSAVASSMSGSLAHRLGRGTTSVCQSVFKSPSII